VLALKTEFPLKIFTVLNVFLHPGFLSSLRLPWNTECALNSLYWIYSFYHSGFLRNSRLPWKIECAQNWIYWIYIFYHSGFLSNLRCPENRVALIFFTVLNMYFLSFRIFEQLALDLKNRVAPEFSTVLKFFYHSGILSNLRLPWKQSLPWTFSSPGSDRPPRPPQRTPMDMGVIKVNMVVSVTRTVSWFIAVDLLTRFKTVTTFRRWWAFFQMHSGGLQVTL